MRTTLQRLAFGAAAVMLAGCASVDIDDALRQTGEAAPGFTPGRLELARTGQQHSARRQLADELLARPVAMNEAVQLALANSPSFQAMVAQGWAELAAARQTGRIANPVFTFERIRFGDELELGRLLSIGLLDLLTLPQRRALSRNQEAQARLQLTANVVDQVGQVRQAWVRAVAAQQVALYADQVKRAAEASAELARRMQQAGNFTRLQRARQHAFYADATTQLASALHTSAATREQLVRVLGLDDAQAARLKLPDRLPDLPAQPKAAAELRSAAMQQRLDWQIAKLQLDVAGKAQGLDLLDSLIDIELGGRHDTVFDNAEGHRANRNGFEVAVRLPVFDWGGAQRANLDAQALLAANRYEAVTRSAASQLRESYSAYRTAYDIARHYRDEIVPLRKTMSEENVLRYNGMLIGVFELLADTRDQIASVMAAINAQQQFWLADAGLSAALIGKPMAAGSTPVSTSTATSNDGRGH